jgi:hypothetical protein
MTALVSTALDISPAVAALGAFLAVSACARTPTGANLDAGSAGPDAATQEFVVVAHEDDDLLFMNPDIRSEILAGGTVRVVYVTAADSGRTDGYWQHREEGILAAYPRLLGVSDSWIEADLDVLGKPVKVRTLVARPTVSVAFLRLPNGSPSGAGNPSQGFASIEKLWIGMIPSMTTVDDAGTYSRQDLVDVLAALMEQFEAASVVTLDSSGLYASRRDGGVGTDFVGEHSDHVFSAFFAYKAQQQISREHGLRMYRAYDIGGEPANVSTADHQIKWDAFCAYAEYDMCLGKSGSDLSKCLDDQAAGLYGSWSWRQYSFAKIASGSGQIKGASGLCLTAQGEGAQVIVNPCTGADSQIWTIERNGTIREGSGLCLEVRGGDPSNGTVAQSAACQAGAEDQWALMDTGQIRGLDGKCLEVSSDGNTSGDGVQIDDCTKSDGQRWSLEQR